MHELSLIQNVVEVALDVAHEHGGLPIQRVVLDIGALQQVVPEALEFAFDAATKDTLAEDAVLEWHLLPTRIECSGCGREFEPDDDVFWVCTECDNIGGRVLQGNELVLRSVELEAPDDADAAQERAAATESPS